MASDALILGPDSWIGRADMLNVARAGTPIVISTPQESAAVLDHALLRGATVYGHSTGYGALASFSGDSEPSDQQAHLIAHLATGTGAPFDARVSRAMTFDRLVTLSKGHSAAGTELLQYIAGILASDAAPHIPRYGSVGASGDLTPLAHLASVLMGAGTYLNGLDPNLEPFHFTQRDALAVVNGTSASNALAVMAWWDIAALLPIMVQSMALMVGAQHLAREAYAATLHQLRGHPGQTAVSSAVRSALDAIQHTSDPTPESKSELIHGALLNHEQSLQSAYSFRCIPQIIGPTVEMMWHAGDTLEREINAVTDNPVFDAPDQVFHGGNFHGQIIAQVCDSLALGVANLANLLDRQIARITDPVLNHGLPPFLTGASAGAHSGFMGAQVSATALAAELSASAQRRYLLQSRSTNGANQDVVSMSTLAGVALYESIPRLRELVAIHLLTAVQAAELAGITGHDELWRWTRGVSPFLSHDRPLSEDIQRTAARLALYTAPDPPGSLTTERTQPPPLDHRLWKTLFPQGPDLVSHIS